LTWTYIDQKTLDTSLELGQGSACDMYNHTLSKHNTDSNHNTHTT